MDKQKVISVFCSLSGINTADKQDDLINMSINQVKTLIKDDTDITKNATVLEYLCGAIAFYNYTVLNACLSPDTIKTLDVTVTINKNAIENAQRIKNDAIILAKSLLIDQNFYFGQVD